ncbi:hypothetical protein GCM10017056_53010 [Seohaeicola zhoushanensis]|uniref:Uncharacterized protein n=2 Tax=Seohaeicola zhoushanensis TaxID=1569283 RepID=A0A8J3MB52_9RHOB|nr:hypothetical protein GCM10017056_53010 [Seohaeicola zhoushanensis]
MRVRSIRENRVCRVSSPLFGLGVAMPRVFKIEKNPMGYGAIELPDLYRRRTCFARAE